MGYDLHWEPPQGVVKRLFGQVSGAELIASGVQVEADPRFDALSYVINDFRDCTAVNVLPRQVEEMAAIDAVAALTNPRIRIAIVATHPEILAGAQAYASDPLTVYPTRLFATMDEARAWVCVATAGAAQPETP